MGVVFGLRVDPPPAVVSTPGQVIPFGDTRPARITHLVIVGRLPRDALCGRPWRRDLFVGDTLFAGSIGRICRVATMQRCSHPFGPFCFVGDEAGAPWTRSEHDGGQERRTNLTITT